MKLKSFGCSFVFGTDLPNDGRWTSIATPSDHAWPSLIANARGLEFECHARPGAGNFEILQRIIEQLAQATGDFYLINWSWIDRFSYIDTRVRGRHPTNPEGWKSVMPIDKDDVATCYYRFLHNQLRDQLETLTAIKTAIDLCQQTQTKFIMTWTDSLIWEKTWATPSMLWLQEQVMPFMHDFEGHSFVEWSKIKGFDISPTMHPLEPAHAAAAELMLPIIDAILHRA